MEIKSNQQSDRWTDKQNVTFTIEIVYNINCYICGQLEVVTVKRTVKQMNRQKVTLIVKIIIQFQT
jgi:hypothetical protein